jgi:DNA-binding NarL/FixJ family response regulator
MKTNVMIVDEHVSVRQMLAGVLNAEGRYSVVAEAGTGAEALRAYRRLKPRMVILDLVLPEMGGLELLRTVRAEARETRVLVYSRSGHREMILAALQARPHGFVRKSDSLATLHEALRAVSAGGSFLTPFATALLDAGAQRPESDAELTPREASVLQMIGEGRSSKEMATVLSISERTVDHYRSSVMRKLDLHCIARLTQAAIRRGLVMLD